MGTIVDKLSYLINTKDIIKQSIIDKGVSVNDNDTFRSYANKISSIQTGSAVTKGEFVCRAIDYDGTILKEEHLDAGEIFTLPSLPTHDGLITQGWSSPVDIVNNMVVVADRDLIFGVMYETASGLSEFDIELTKNTGLTITFNMDGTKNWGDGTTDTATTHTYADYGKYTITCDGVNVGTDSTRLWGQTSNYPNYYCISARLSKNVVIKQYAFSFCYSLEYITIPQGVTGLGIGALAQCYSLKCIIIPNGVTIMNQSVCSYSNAKNIVIPNSVTELGKEAIFNAGGVANLTIPDTITSIGQSAMGSCYILDNLTIINTPVINQQLLQGCRGLKKIKLGNVTSIASDAFRNLYSLSYIDFSSCISVPTLSGSTTFSGINGNAKIIVPNDLYDSWISATNWITYAKYIYKKSEVL